MKSGHLELQRGQGKLRSYKRRFAVIRKNGIVDLFETEQRFADGQRPKESFHLQGGEELQQPDNYKKRFLLKLVIAGHKREHRWKLGFESEASRADWRRVLQGLLKHLSALNRLHAVMTGSNAESMHGQLQIGAALADCGQLSRALRIFAKLIAKHDEPEAHREFEAFLSLHCHDVHRAEMHHLRRLPFLVVPKQLFAQATPRGQRFAAITQRVEFFASAKAQLKGHQYEA